MTISARAATRGFLYSASLILGILAWPTLGQAASSDGTEPPNPNPACRAGQQYIAASNVKKPGDMGNLFADHPDYMGPDGKMRHDRDEVTAVYTKILTSASPKTRIVDLAPIGRRSCLMEFEVKYDDATDFTPVAVDHFDVDKNGKITKFLPYLLSSQVAKVRATAEGGTK